MCHNGFTSITYEIRSFIVNLANEKVFVILLCIELNVSNFIFGPKLLQLFRQSQACLQSLQKSCH
jgi:hypothetical protein